MYNTVKLITLLDTDVCLAPQLQTSWVHLVHRGQHPAAQPGIWHVFQLHRMHPERTVSLYIYLKRIIIYTEDLIWVVISYKIYEMSLWKRFINFIWYDYECRILFYHFEGWTTFSRKHNVVRDSVTIIPTHYQCNMWSHDLYDRLLHWNNSSIIW